MNKQKKKMLIKITGMLTLIEGIALLPCVIASLVYDNNNTVYALLVLSLLFITFGVVTIRTLKSYRFKLKPYEGFLVSTLCWVYCSFLGSLPYRFGGNNYTFIRSLFESAAGFTTTGCTVFNLDLMPKGLLLWRALSSWLGGMGILLLVVSVLPALGISGQRIASTETTGPSLEKFGGRFSSTGQFLYVIYSLFTLVEFILLAMGPLPMFDAFINTCSSISTGGLLITSKTAPAFSNIYIRAVIMAFTLLSSMNFTLYHHFIGGRHRAITSNAEVRTFWFIIAISTFLITIDLVHSKTYTNAFQAFKDGISQVISFISTSGYYVCDYSRWPTFTTILLFVLLLIGGCSMSTSGSLKVIRVMVFFKLIARGLFKQIHPRSVKAVKISGRAISAEKVAEITAHILLYFMVLFFSFVVVSFDNLGMTTTITSVIGTFTNTGIAIGGPGATGYFGMFSNFSLFYLTFLMIVGRLEMFAILVLFTKSFRNINRPEQI